MTRTPGGSGTPKSEGDGDYVNMTDNNYQVAVISYTNLNSSPDYSSMPDIKYDNLNGSYENAAAMEMTEKDSNENVYEDIDKPLSANKGSPPEKMPDIVPLKSDSFKVVLQRNRWFSRRRRKPCKCPSMYCWLIIFCSVLVASVIIAIVVKIVIRVPEDCEDIQTYGQSKSGVYTIFPSDKNPLQVYCEQELDKGGWTVIQQRQDGSVDFYRNWTEYKVGFGNASSEYWIGNDNIHKLTHRRRQRLKIELQHYNGVTVYADYSSFSIEDEGDKYRLHISGFSSTSSNLYDALSGHSGAKFTTPDQDNDVWSQGNCATYHSAAWWFTDCFGASLNGIYNGTLNTGIHWWHFAHGDVSVKAVRMMIKSD